MAQEGDIVFMIGADVAGLTRAGQAGERSLADMEKAAKALEREISKVGQAGVDFQREMNKLTGVTREVGKSARDSAAAFEAFDKSKAQVDALRASIDPLFAASKRYEQALGTLDTALEQGAISARQHAQMTDQLAAAYLRADGAARTAKTGMGGFGGGVQQVGYQIQDFAVQIGAGTSATQAFAQQFPQMASAFGPWGVAIGTAAAILVPLGMAFLTSAEQADTLTSAADRQKAAIEGLTGATERLRLERQMAETGAVMEEQQIAVNRINELLKERQLLETQITSFVKANRAAKADELRDQLAIVDANIATVREKLRELEVERNLKTARETAKVAMEQMRSIMSQLGSADISSPWQNVIGWIQQAADKAREYAMASQIYGAVGARGDPRAFGANAGGSNTFGVENFGVGGASGGGGGGGGGGQNPIVAQLEALRQQMLTEEQIELESYARRQEMLAQALDQQLLTQQEYAALMQRSQQEHSDKMSEIDVYRYGSGLDKASAFFGEMASAMQGGNEEMLKISKAFGAAQALISAWQGAAEALKLPFPSNMAAFAKVLSTGLGAVNAIKGAKKGGTTSGAGAGGGAGAATGATPVQTMNFNITNDPFGFGERIARQMASQLNEAQRNGSSIRATVNAI
jgi:hypothetical protein